MCTCTQTSCDLQKAAQRSAVVRAVLERGGTTVDCVMALVERMAALTDRVVELESLAPRRIRLPNGKEVVYHLPDHLVPYGNDGQPVNPPIKPAECACQGWCEDDLRVQFLTGHHSRCPDGGNPLEAAFKLLKELTRGIECWATEEDGEVYADCWKAYRKAKALEGVFLPEESKQV